MKVPQTLYFRINRWPTNPKDMEQQFATIPRRKTLLLRKINSCKNRMLETFYYGLIVIQNNCCSAILINRKICVQAKSVAFYGSLFVM